MRLRKDITRATAFTLVGALGVAGIFAVNNQSVEESTAVAGSWETFVSTAWMNENDARYKGYKETPGTTEASPYLIQTAEEFSGIRAFENGSALAGKYLMLTKDIDLSAHYWDPIEVYGAGSPEDDIWDGIYYGDGLNLAADSEVVHINGNSMKISGMNIQNAYDKVIAGTDRGVSNVGSTGLFSYAYKASISDIRLEKPVMSLTETSGVPIYDSDYYDYETPVSDFMGAVVGVAQNSHIAGVHVNDLSLNYTAEFGEFVNEPCPSYADSRSVPQKVDGCGTYFSPVQIAAGGAVGVSFGETLVSETSVKGGTVNVAPVVDEDAAYGWGMDVLYGSGIVSVAGLAGMNFDSTILSTCSSADVVFSDDGYNVHGMQENPVYYEGFSMIDNDEVAVDALNAAADEGRPLGYYGMYFGGLIGFSANDMGGVASGAVKCVYNSCSHSELKIDAEISNATTIGGVVGVAIQDRIINNYYDGNVTTSSDNVFGEILGVFGQYDDDSSALRSNFYLNRGNEPIGYELDGYTYAGFATISTVEKLAEDLNMGRAYVMGDLASNSSLNAGQIALMTTEWSILDGTFPLACTNMRSAGLVFPDNRIDVPNTGAK